MRTRGLCGVAGRIEGDSAAVDSVGLFACKELGIEFNARAFLHDESTPRRHEGFMVTTMNPLSWEVAPVPPSPTKGTTEFRPTGRVHH